MPTISEDVVLFSMTRSDATEQFVRDLFALSHLPSVLSSSQVGDVDQRYASKDCTWVPGYDNDRATAVPPCLVKMP